VTSSKSTKMIKSMQLQEAMEDYMSGGQQQALTVLPEESTPFFLQVVRINTSTYLS
jgi:hypothetical protein